MCCCFDGEVCEVWHERDRTARKAWACYECTEGIEPGQRYRVVKTLYDGFWSTYRLCGRCARRYDEASRQRVGFITLGELRDWSALIDCTPWINPYGGGGTSDRCVAEWGRRAGLLVKWLFEDADRGQEEGRAA